MLEGQPLPEEIRGLLWFVRGISSLDALQMRQAQRKIDAFQNYLELQFDRCFPKSKHCSEDAIGNHIFKLLYNQRDERAITKYELSGLISMLGRAVDDIKKLVESEEFILAFHELKLVGDYVNDSIRIIEKVSELQGASIKYAFSRRNVLDSIEPFKLSRYLLGGLVSDGLENRAASIFLIRQSLELKIKNALGVHSFVSESGLEKLTGFIFLDILQENKDNFSLPVNFKIFQKIVDWTNASIHSGWVPPAWKIDWAHNYLEPLFKPGYNNKTFSAYGAIKVKKAFLDNIEYTLQEFLRSKDRKVQESIRVGSHNRPDKYDSLKIISRHPESILMDDS